MFVGNHISLAEELVWKDEDLCHYKYMNIMNVYTLRDLRSVGNAPRSHVASCVMPTWMSNWGARNSRKTTQSRYEIWPNIIVVQVKFEGSQGVE
jgi:hypothetical protein